MYGEPFRFEQVAEPTREQQQAAADQILAEIKALYGGLEALGREGVLRTRARDERRAAPRAAAGRSVEPTAAPAQPHVGR